MRKQVGIVIDYSIRMPDFKESYLKLKEQILVGIPAGQHLDADDIKITKKLDTRNYWNNLQNKDPKSVEFYTKCAIPDSNFGPDFDITYKKYFPNEEQRIKFLEEWSYNLFGQGALINKMDITLINTAQTKLFDIVLIDRATHTRKVPNTFAFLARSGIFTKQVLFVNNQKEMDQLHEDLFAVWDPYKDRNQIIEPIATYGQPTKPFLDWLMSLESKINKKEKESKKVKV